MSNKESYIGIPNGVVLCIDEVLYEGRFQARMYHGYRRDAVEVGSYEVLIREMGDLFDQMKYPWSAMRVRTFSDEESQPKPSPGRMGRKDRIMSDKELLSKHGDIGTFIIRVQQRQNSTWQGRITWVEEDKTMRFRSALEMIKLIESGIAAENPDLVEEKDHTWD